jgi:hypothetical protein
MNETFTVKRIQEIGDAVVGFFDKEAVKTAEDLERRVGNEFRGLRENEFILVAMHPSNHCTRACTMSYVVQGSGIPVEVKVNADLRYSALIVKAELPILGFTPFAVDPNNNCVQHKYMQTVDIGEIREALRSMRAFAYG